MLIGFTKEQQQGWERRIVAFGGHVVEEEEAATHVVVTNRAADVKGRGKEGGHVIWASWLNACCEQKKCVPTRSYDVFTSKK